MISVACAREKIVKTIAPLQKIELMEILSCSGRVSAQDMQSNENIPPFDNTAMDGFAVRAVDVKGASRENPKTLQVIENLPAGYTAKLSLKPSEAIRIMTGAPMPQGADSVVMVEYTEKATRSL